MLSPSPATAGRFLSGCSGNPRGRPLGRRNKLTILKEALRDFAFVLLLGIVIGTSSSIFIAAPILLFLGQKALRPGAPARVAASEPAE